jgi:hypothetical protein
VYQVELAHETERKEITSRGRAAAQKWVEDSEATQENQKGEGLMPKRKSPWKQHRHSDEATLKAPTFLPGDPVVTATGASGRVMYATARGDVFIELSDGRKLCQHEDTLQWPASFTPTGRRN